MRLRPLLVVTGAGLTVGLFGLRGVLTPKRLAGVAGVAAVGVFVLSWARE